MFDQIKKEVQERMAFINQHELFIMDVERDELYDLYIDSLPEEKKQDHRCNCCRQFLRNYGHIVAIVEGRIETLWGFEIPGVYEKVPEALEALLKSKSVKDYFVTKTIKLGTDFNHQQTGDGVITWGHFYTKLPKERKNRSHKSEASIMGDLRSVKDVFKRSLDELTIESTETVLELIKENNLYRGEEHKSVLTTFLTDQKTYRIMSALSRDLYTWVNTSKSGKIRNSAIGTLLINLSEGKPVEQAVKMYENVVAPSNYKRPKALVTASMLKKATEDITEMGYLESLRRRYANIDDIPVAEVIHINRSSVIVSKGILDELKEDLPVKASSFKKAISIKIDDFVKDIIPGSSNIEVLMESKHESNLMTMIAPVDSDSKSMFPWSNGLSWDYKGNVADSVKERVKAQGGSVEGELRVSLDWFNYDDLDLHVIEPSGNRIYFSDKHSPISCGFLDVDMNAGGKKSREAVENVIFKDRNSLPEGDYKVLVKNYAKKENKDFGFNIEVECQGNLMTFGQSSAVRSGEIVEVVTFNYSKTKGITLVKGDVSNTQVVSKEIWGVDTNKFHKVAVICHSPNHWNTESGHRHTFFIIDGVKNEEAPRGFFNEFLKPELLGYKRVFELLGNKTKVETTDTELSGLGFSSTKNAEVYVRINNKQVFNVKF